MARPVSTSSVEVGAGALREKKASSRSSGRSGGGPPRPPTTRRRPPGSCPWPRDGALLHGNRIRAARRRRGWRHGLRVRPTRPRHGSRVFARAGRLDRDHVLARARFLPGCNAPAASVVVSADDGGGRARPTTRAPASATPEASVARPVTTRSRVLERCGRREQPPRERDGRESSVSTAGFTQRVMAIGRENDMGRASIQ